MRFDELLQRLLDQIDQEQAMTRRTALFIAPPLVFVLMALTTQLFRGPWEFVAAFLGVMMLVVKFDFFTRPTIQRVRQFMQDVALYLSNDAGQEAPASAPTPPAARLTPQVLLLPSLLGALGSLLIFVPALIGRVAPWQVFVGVGCAIGLLLLIGERLLRVQRVLSEARARFSLGLLRFGAARRSTEATRKQLADGLLDPALLLRLEAQPMPVMPLSPAAQALVRTEAYLLLRDAPGLADNELREAMQAWAAQAHADELDHWVLPAVGGKVYLPCNAHGIVARALAATARRLGMEGAYSATLGTWLLRLPPARSYAVAARLIDAVAALGMLPPGATLIHHLTVAGDMGSEATMPALLHLLATPLLFEERPDHARGDERTFIMRGGGVMDDLDRGVRTTGPRTDFVDGFLFIDVPGMDAVEQLTAHAVNLRLKQLCAWAAYAAKRPPERRSRTEEQAALRYARLRSDLAAFLARYDLQGALAIPWLDGSWSEQWPYLQSISTLKQSDPDFLDDAQAIRDAALSDLEALAVRAAGQSRRAA